MPPLSFLLLARPLAPSCLETSYISKERVRNFERGKAMVMKGCGLVLAAAIVVGFSNPALAQFPGNGYWGHYQASNSNYHKRAAYGELRENLEPDVRDTPSDPHIANYMEGRGYTHHGSGFSAYQSNQYRGKSALNMYYGYWDGGFNPGLYGFSMYPHFDRPGFTYWQGGN
jgi:hypothetical protein